MSTWRELRDNPRLKKMYADRSMIIRFIREFFWQNGFLETDTPIAVKLPGQEPYLNPVPITIHPPDFATTKSLRAGDPYNSAHKMYLITSPELSLKKLLAAGFEKIFSITKCFRDYESFGGTHNTEFTMIEWYRAPGTYQNFMDDMEALFKFVAERLKIEELRFEDHKIKVDQPWVRKSMKAVWQEYIGVDLGNYLESQRLKELAKDRGLQVVESDTYEDLFFKIFLNFIEPNLGLGCPIFIYDYPAQMTSLSRLCAHDPRYAERVECYIGGLELCNGFGELLDADEQRARLVTDQTLRAKLGKETWPIDEDFIAALPAIATSAVAGEDRGPARQSSAGTAAGVALGVDRMVLLFTGAKDINEVIFQSISDQLAN